MKNNSQLQRRKEQLMDRWSEEDYPGGKPRFQLHLLAKDFAVFCIIPLSAIIIFKILESSVTSAPRQVERRRTIDRTDPNRKTSQIINFQHRRGHKNSYGFSRRAPGTLVRVRLMNVVETYSAAPVHAQIINDSLGKEFRGGTIIGQATSDAASGRINIDFQFVRHPKRLDLAVPISAQAMSLDGTFGVVGNKKEGFFARAAIRSASDNPNSVDAGADKGDFRSLVARALAAGMMQEFQSEASVAHNNAQVMTLKPMTEFFVELTDYFPGQHKS